MENISTKDFFIKYGILMGVIVVIFGLLIYVNIYSRRSWNNNLKFSIEKVLNEKDSGSWEIQNQIDIKNPLVLNAVCYEAKHKNEDALYKVVMVRTVSFYGPVPAVFICDSENNVSFIGYSSLHGRITEQLMNNKSDKRLEYWQEKIPEIIE